MRQRRSLPLLAAAATLLCACSSAPVNDVPPPPVLASLRYPAARAAGADVVSQPAAASKITAVDLPTHLNPSSLLFSQRTVFFDYDTATISAESTVMLERHGRYLAAHPDLTVTIEGHTDERGSTEYNLALGQRRAESVVKALLLFGVKDEQMEAISWGRERPLATGHDESAWSQNRRVEIQYAQP